MTTEATIRGMSCDGCRQAVLRILKAQGEDEARVELSTGAARLSADLDRERITAALRRGGYAIEFRAAAR